MTMVEMEKQLKSLRLDGMLATLESRALQANQGNVAFTEALSWLLQDEMDHRASGLRQRRFKASGLNELKTLTEFDWGFNPKLPKKEKPRCGGGLAFGGHFAPYQRRFHRPCGVKGGRAEAGNNQRGDGPRPADCHRERKKAEHP